MFHKALAKNERLSEKENTLKYSFDNGMSVKYNYNNIVLFFLPDYPSQNIPLQQKMGPCLSRSDFGKAVDSDALSLDLHISLTFGHSSWSANPMSAYRSVLL